MFSEETKKIYMHLSEVLRQLDSVRDDYPEQGWALLHLYEDVKESRKRINEMLQS